MSKSQARPALAALPDDFNGADYMTVAEAREALHKSKAAMSGLIAAGTFKTLIPSPLDKRVKLIRRDEVARFASVPRPSFHRATPGASSLAVAVGA